MRSAHRLRIMPRAPVREALTAEDLAVFLDGAWPRLVAAKNVLHASLVESFFDPESPEDAGIIIHGNPRAIHPHQKGLTLAQSKELLTGHLGLHGEFANSLEPAVNDEVRPSDSKPLSQRLAALHHAFQEESQIAKSGGLTTKGDRTKMAALQRCGDVIAQYLEENHATIPADERQQIEANLTEFRSALRATQLAVGGTAPRAHVSHVARAMQAGDTHTGMQM